ncbi:hypothetical protein FRB96_004284 [Tulasnella sp. 330]|nr:hypothetical protein FRB96_004284 [Tulasnella sp. 330]
MSGSSSSKLNVAVIGATGNLGPSIVKAFLNLRPEAISRVIVLTRNPKSENAKALEMLGAEMVQINGPSMQEAAASGVKVYFPSEYGVDHRYGPQNHVWFNEKERHSSAARNEAPGQLKVIKLYIGMFTEIIFSPFFGLDNKSGVYTSLGLGTSDKKVAITSTADIGAAIARLSTLAVADPQSVPDDVRISGDNKSWNELADIVGRATGKTIKVVEEPVEGADDKDGEDLPALARLNFARGAVDFSKDNDNELVNPGQKYWTWKTTEVYARDVLAKQ